MPPTINIYSPAEIGRSGGQERPAKILSSVPKCPSSSAITATSTMSLTKPLLSWKGCWHWKDTWDLYFPASQAKAYGPSRRDSLFKYLASLPTDLCFFLEVRNAQWFSDPLMRKELFDTLRSLNVGAVITDTAGRRDCAHMQLPVPDTFVRFVCKPAPSYRLCTRSMPGSIGLLIGSSSGLEELYFFVHMPDEMYCPELDRLYHRQVESGFAICNYKSLISCKPTKPAAGTQISFFD